MESHLKWPDYLILVGFLVILLAIGFYHSVTGGRQKTTAEFIMNDRRLKVIPTAISLLVSFQSAIVFLGLTAEIYSYGVQYLIFSNVAAIVAMVAVERVIVPWIYPLQLVSIFSYLERRYLSKSMRIFGASMGIMAAVLYMGVAMYAPSAALEFATGLPLAVSIPLMAVVCLAYTALGGMRAVIWTDVFQFWVMIAGIVAILVKGLIVVGGITNVFRLAGEEGRLVLTNLSADPRVRNTVWSILFGIGIEHLDTFGFLQASVQRYSSVDKLSSARMTILSIITPTVIMNVVLGFIGLIILAYYSSIKCDPLANKEIDSANQLLPYFVVTIFADSPGFAGLFLSTLYGGALSTVSSVLSGSAANCWEDILKWKLDHLPESRKAFINRLLVVLFGVLATGVAFLSASLPGPILQVLSALGAAVAAPTMALFVVGGLSRHANWKGMLFGGVAGLLFTLWLSIGSMTMPQQHPPLAPVSVEQCSLENGNSTFLRYANFTSYWTSDGIGVKNSWNQTTDALSGANSDVAQLRGLENFYAVSYMWFVPFGIIVTAVVGITASFIMRDKELEEKVDKRLLFWFQFCKSSDDENKHHLDAQSNALLQNTKALQGPENGFIKDVEMKLLRETENGFHMKIKGDLDERKNGFLPKQDSGRIS